jgi:hypothetical protein
MLDEVGLSAYRLAKVSFISEDNKIEFYQKIAFTDESWLCAEAFHLGYVKLFSGEFLLDEYAIKKTRFKGNKKLFVSAAISFDGSEQLYFIEGNENTDCYEEIFNACLPDIPKLYCGEYIL